MRLCGVLLAILPSLALLSGVCATLPIPIPDQEALVTDPSHVGERTPRKLQQPSFFRQYIGWEYENYPLPPDYQLPAEWVFARFMYRAVWTPRGRLGNWTIDYPRSDRHLSAAVRRLTRIDARSAEQPVAAEDNDDIYNWPWLYGVEVGHWDLTDLQVAKLRDFLERGGFFMCDDFHGTWEWETFVRSMKRVLPGRPIVEIPNSDPIFHTVYDLDDRYQVPGEQVLYTNSRWEKDGYEARWRGIYDDKGRLIVAICHNMDLGDSWEHADNPRYPEQYSALGFRIGVNYIVYAMTH
ncbi:MAG: DUF4159 domain-containing protein [Acidobacteriaceae bacterium]|nr:DUF4159 domain-containing protein [Acidobacteriaceae bacterium]